MCKISLNGRNFNRTPQKNITIITGSRTYEIVILGGRTDEVTGPVVSTRPGREGETTVDDRR